MKRFAFLLLSLCCFSNILSAQEEITVNDTIPAEPEVNYWRPLFNEDLSNAVYDPAIWTMDKGILTASAEGYIWTTETYENFELDVDFKTGDGTNSGILFYCTDTENWIPNTVEIQLADDYYEPWSDTRITERCGSVYGHLGPTKDKIVKKPGEWNHIRVKAVGQHITVILNGKKVTNMDMSQWTSATTNPDGTSIPEWFTRPFAELTTKGVIGFQGKHGESSIWLRNIKIRNAK